MLLNSPAGSLRNALAAIEAGADSVYIGFSDLPHQRSQCRNLDLAELDTLIDAANGRAEVLLTFNSSYPPEQLRAVQRRIDVVSQRGVTGLIIADPGLLRWVAQRHRHLKRTFSVQGQCANRATARRLVDIGADRIVLDRDTTLQEAAAIAAVGVEVELFAFGYMCNARDSVCYMGDHWSGSPCNVHCAQKVEVLDAAGRFGARPIFMKYYSILHYIPLCLHYGIDVLKIEGRHRSEAFVRAVTGVFREAMDHARACADSGQRFAVHDAWARSLKTAALGFEVTRGRYVEGDYERDRFSGPGLDNALLFGADALANAAQTGGVRALVEQLKSATARGAGSSTGDVPSWRGPLP